MGTGSAEHPTRAGPPEDEASQIERRSLELDGVFTRLRRGSVPMEGQEQHREGDMSREINVGAVFEARAGRERSEVVSADALVKGHVCSVVRRTAFGDVARRVVGRGDGAPRGWRLVHELFPEAVLIVDRFPAQKQVWGVAAAV